MQKYFLVLLISFLTYGLQAQNAEDTLKQEANGFIDAYANLLQHRDKDKVLKYVSTSLKSMVLSTDIRNKVRMVHNDYSRFEDFLDKIIHTDELTIKYELKDMIKVTVNRHTGLVVYAVDYEINENGKVWTKGTEIVNLAYRKQHDKWEIVYFTVISMEDKKLKGTCYCKFFESQQKEHFVVMTQEPEGKQYNEHLNTFDFKRVSADHKLIRTKTDTYRWLPTGGVWLVSTGTKDEIKLGDAKTEKDVMLVIIKKHIYKDHCGSLRIKH